MREDYLGQPGAGLAGYPGGEAKVPDDGGQPARLLLDQNVFGGEVTVEKS